MQLLHSGIIVPRRPPLRRPAVLLPPGLMAAPLRYDSFLGGGGGSAGPALAWSFTDSGVATTGTIAGLDFGAVAGDREIIVTFGWVSRFQLIELTAVSIDGVAATQVVENIGGTQTSNAEIWRANVPTGTSGTISVTSSGIQPDRMSMAVYRATGLSSTTPVDTGVGTAPSGDNISVPLDATAGGFVVAVVVAQNTTSPDLSDVTLDHSGSAGSSHSARHGSLETPSNGTFTVNSTAGVARRLAAATWF